MKYVAATFLLLFVILDCFSQKQDTLVNRKTTIAVAANESFDIEQIQSEDTAHSPRLAALYSAVLPGAGQFYNEKYWKIPLIYALGVFAAYQIKSNHQNYLLFSNINFNLKDGNPANDGDVSDYVNVINEIGITRRVDAFKRDRDYWIILSGLFYVLNIVDATVDAHLREFNLNDNLSMRIEPSVQQSPYQNMHAGLMLNFRIKGRNTN